MKDLRLGLNKVFLFLFLLLIPTQLGRHFWPEWSYVLGIRVDYLSPTLYVVDLVWLGLFLMNIRKFRELIKKLFNFKTFLILLFVVVNILISANKWVCFFKWLRLLELGFMIFLLRQEKTEVKKILMWVLPCWIIGESVLGLAQMIKGGSLNGLFYFLGERNFSFNTIGVAQISVLGQGLVRIYGTFSHPNSLAGFILVAVLLWMKIKPSVLRTSPLTGRLIFWWVVIWFGILAIGLAGSRLVWALTLGIFLFLVYQQKRKIKSLIAVLLISGGIFALILSVVGTNYSVKNFVGGWDKDGISKRINLDLVALKMTKESFWMGNGLNNFLVKLPDFQKKNGLLWLQPAHNVGLLILAEVGVIGLGLFIWGIMNYFKNKKWQQIDLLIIGVIVITGMWDHYWYTLPQNMWLVVVVLGVI